MDRSTVKPSMFGGAEALPLLGVHDESGIYRAHRYFVTGFVFVPEANVNDLLRDLRTVRVDLDYWGEVHYCRVGSVSGPWSAKYETARDWAAVVEAAMVAGTVRAKVLAVDVRARTYEHQRFRRHRHFAYNRFTRLALESGLQWCYGSESALRVRLLSDAKSRRPGGDDEEPAGGDNFTEYLPKIAARRIQGEPTWPNVEFVPNRVEEVDPGDVHRECEPECELVQLADLVISAVAAAIRGPSEKAGKRRLARTAAGWVRESRYGNWKPRLNLWRKFSASLFVPGAADCWPEPVPLAIDPAAGDDQLSLLG